MKPFGTVLVAGTFDCLHRGHARLLAAALASGRRVLIGLSSDEFAKKRRHASVAPFEERKRLLSALLAHRNGKCEVFRLESATEPAASMRGLDALVASEETKPAAQRINAIRRRRRLKPLRLIIIPTIFAQDLQPISCERIRQGKIDLNGKRITPLLLAVGTSNPAKLKPIQPTAEKIFGKIPLRVSTVPVKKNAPKQPFGKQTIAWAEERARLAFARTRGCDYGIGLESGLFRFGGRLYDLLWCCVFDGRTSSFGCSMGFEIPGELAGLAKKGMDLSEAFEKMTGEKHIGRREGVLGRISGGLAARPDMVAQAMEMAFVPRIARAMPWKGALRPWTSSSFSSPGVL
ncbi:MAG: pantetheine-phosphate adenylyltransferase [Candidatus Micrarchaeia archaeon]